MNENTIIRQNCKSCKYCAQIGRQQSQQGQLGRKNYFCEHPDTNNLKDKWGLPLFPFIGFGNMTARSPLQLKTYKRWCPLKNR